ncbi:MAG: hypothetical protein HUU38_04165 [Anaerolineales bacterium]|nr:hypothetical protein [Anaerolineales bacterium]
MFSYLKKENMSDLRAINPNLVDVIRRKSPKVTDRQVIDLVDKLESLVGEHLIKGDSLAFIGKDEDGITKIVVYDTEILNHHENIIKEQKNE